jgi:hypothetical protein
MRSKSNISKDMGKDRNFPGEVIPKQDDTISLSHIKSSYIGGDKSESTIIKSFSNNFRKKTKVNLYLIKLERQ